MKKLDIIPLRSVGPVQFQMDRQLIREKLGLNYKEIKKSVFSKNTMDAYESFHIYYDKDNRLQAIEFFDGAKLTLKGKNIFPGTLAEAKKQIVDLIADGGSYISKSMSIGLTVSTDDQDVLESILVGCKDYYGK